MTTFLKTRAAGAVVTTAIVGLTLATAYIHLSLGGLLFTLNGLGYVGLAALVIIAASVAHPLVQRFAWFPRLGVLGYTSLTIGAYLVMGPYFTLGFITKGIEVALVALVIVDIVRVYGGPRGFIRAATESLAPVLPARLRSI